MSTYHPGTDIDAAQTAMATELRVPLLNSAYPRWHYVTGIAVNDTPYLDPGLVPTDDEVRMVAAHLDDYCTYWYRPSYRSRMREFAPYDIDSGANLGFYRKRGENDWCYRKRTWQQGPSWWPAPLLPPMTLAEVIAHNGGDSLRERADKRRGETKLR